VAEVDEMVSKRQAQGRGMRDWLGIMGDGGTGGFVVMGRDRK
jgi:hypothetical protein